MMKKDWYRGYDDVAGRWVYGYLGGRNGLATMIINTMDGPVAVKEWTVGQNTGLVDCDGVDIYEDDIVQPVHPDLCSRCKLNQWVVYLGYAGAYKMVNKRDDVGCLDFRCGGIEVRVIGNTNTGGYRELLFSRHNNGVRLGEVWG